MAEKLDKLYEGWDAFTAWGGDTGAYSLSGGELHFSGAQSSASYIIDHDVTDWDLDESSLHLVLVLAQSADYNAAFRLLHADPTDNIWIFWSGFENRLRIRSVINGTHTTHYNVLMNPGIGFPVFLRIVETGGTTTVDTSLDGTAWTNRASFSTLDGHTTTRPRFDHFAGGGGTATWGPLNPDNVGGGSPVGSQRELAWDVAAPVGVSRSFVWDVTTPAGSARTVSYDVRAPVGVDRSVEWNVGTPVGASREASWRVLTHVAADRSLVWDVAALAGTEREAVWHIALTVGSQRESVWDVVALAGAERVLVWDVVSNLDLTAIGSEREAVWSVAALAGAERSILYDLRATAGSQRQLRYAITSLLAIERELAWAVRIDVGSERSLLWTVIGQAGASRVLVWDVASLNQPPTRIVRITGSAREPVGIVGAQPVGIVGGAKPVRIEGTT